VKEEIGRDRPPGGPTSRRRRIGPTDFHAAGVVFIPDGARFSHLLSLPEGANVGQAVNEAMRAIEKANPDLADVLARQTPPQERPKGKRGGAHQFYTPTSIVKLIVEILEPYHGRILDPACGSSGMFIQSARFVEAHQKNPTAEISVHGQERVTDTARLARLNLAVHGLSGDIKQGNTYYEDLQDSVGRFDFVMANPPFNVSKIDKERLAGDPRYPFGIPRTDNGNYLWIQHFHSALNKKGRAGFVMANSAADARASEQEIREKIIRAGHVDVMVAIGPNFFFTVTLPCTLWFFDKGKSEIQNQQSSIGNRKDTVLFIDARHIYRQLDRAHRDFTPAQLEFLANIVRFYRGEDLEFNHGSEGKWAEVFENESSSSLKTENFKLATYHDIPGLCKAATLQEIEAQGWSLNPGRYVGVAKGEDLSDEDFKEQLEALNEELEVLNEELEVLNEELEVLNAEARELEEKIAENVVELLEA